MKVFFCTSIETNEVNTRLQYIVTSLHRKQAQSDTLSVRSMTNPMGKLNESRLYETGKLIYPQLL